MIERIEMSENPDKKLYTSFVIRADQVLADNLLVEFAGYEMGKRLEEQRNNGFSGWNTPQCENKDLKERLLKNLEKGDYVDVLNLAAMLLARERLFNEIPLMVNNINRERNANTR